VCERRKTQSHVQCAWHQWCTGMGGRAWGGGGGEEKGTPPTKSHHWSKLIESMDRTPAEPRGAAVMMEAGVPGKHEAPAPPGGAMAKGTGSTAPRFPRVFFSRGVVSWAREQAPVTAAAAEAAAARPLGVFEVDKGTAPWPGVRPWGRP
jgi:hypothetical protein